MDSIVLWARACPAWVADVLLALALAAITAVGTAAQGPLRGYRHVDALAYLLAVGGALAIAWRRRHPTGVFAATLIAAVVFAARGYRGGPALVAVLIAVYTAACLQSRLRSLAFALMAGVAISATRLVFTSEAVGSTAVNALGWIGASLFLGWAVANRRAFVAEIRDRAERAERTREEEARRRVDAERLRIARELHDVVAHTISTINVQAGVGAHVIDTRPAQAAQALASIKQTSKEALRELRAILDVLRQVDEPDPRAPTPGLDHLDVLISTTTQAGIRTELQVRGAPRSLPPTIDLTAYRIVQESLTNVLRHARAASATVTISYDDHNVEITVSDDGEKSGEAAAFTEGGGHGIAGMRERASAVGGSLDAGPGPRGGFRVSAVLPLEEAQVR